MMSDITGQIIQAAFEIGRALRTKVMKCADHIHMAQLHTLAFIREKRGITMKELACMLNVTSPSATVFVDRLEKMGFVRRRHDLRDRKIIRLSVTPAGKRILHEKMAEKKKLVSAILSSLSIEDQHTLLKLIRKMIKSCSDQ